jgi:hypothetical protein
MIGIKQLRLLAAHSRVAQARGRRQKHTYFFRWRAVIFAGAVALSFSASASEFAEAQAIEAVKSATAASCTELTPCTFQAQRANGRWTVIVEHTKRITPSDPPLPYKGGREVFVLGDHGKIVMVLREK